MTDTQKMIDLLEMALRKAYDGELLACAIATVEYDNTVGTNYVVGSNIAKLHYACANLTQRVLNDEGELLPMKRCASRAWLPTRERRLLG